MKMAIDRPIFDENVVAVMIFDDVQEWSLSHVTQEKGVESRTLLREDRGYLRALQS
jgi:hypothetical protein